MKSGRKYNMTTFEFFPWNNMRIKEYIKRPIPISAVQINEDFEVKTLEGTMKGKAGDYLISGIKQEIYCCDKKIFEESYELYGKENFV
jgi:hypothetical protein